MGKMKVHELAKELNMPSKDLVDKLIELNYDVKSHLSVLQDEDVEKIKKQLKNDKIKDAPKVAKKVEEKATTKKEKKPIAPVIIRREVTRIETTSESKKETKVSGNRDELGVVQRRTDTSMNIKYRTPPKKIVPITPQKANVVENIPKISNENKIQNSLKTAEKTQESKDENKVKENKKVENSKNMIGIVETNKEEIVKKEVNTIEKKTPRNVVPNNDRAFGRNENNAQTRNNSYNRFDNKNNRANNGNFQKREHSDNRQQYNKDNRWANKPYVQKESKVEKEIKGIMANMEVIQKEPAREIVRTGYKDKEKENRKFEDSPKKGKAKNIRAEKDDINLGKLKDLQSENKLSNMFDDTDSKMFDYYDLSKRKGNRKNKRKPVESKEHIDQKIFELTDIDIPEIVTVKELAEKLKKQAAEVIKKLLGYGVLATLNNELDFDTAFLVASEFGVTAHKKEVVSDEDILFDETDDADENLVPRPPIVVVMGHVDHGKTSLLDAIRSTNVIEKEAGGITQHIGAYKVKINDREITFIDTPGHEAFTAMRARGAQVTDVAIIVVAADDGIMPQTVEAINHAKAAGVSIIVAINKIDKEGANVERVKQEIMEYGLVPEEWGGDVICVPISATQHKNIDSLLEMVLLVADMKELKSNPNKQAKGTIIEARLDKNTGITVSLLVQRGTLNLGDTIVVGSVIGKIRGMTDDKGQKVVSAGPSTPVEIIGLPELPEAGEVFYEVENEKVAKHLIEKRKRKQREEMLKKSAPLTLDNLFNQIEEGKLKDLNIIIKADLQGSVQALKQSLEKIRNEEARVRIIHSNVGGITESDVTLAKVTNSIIIGFNVRPEQLAKAMADREGVEIKIYSIIYNAIDDVTAALKGMLQPKYKEVTQGTAEIRQTFKITNVGMIAGCYVLEGKIVRNSGLRVIRDNVVIHTGKLASLKRMKDDAKEVAAGYECGVQIENYEDIKVGDKLESFILEEIKQ